MTNINEYVTTEQERQLLACEPFNEPARYADLTDLRVVDERWFENGGADWDETSLAASLWFYQLNGGFGDESRRVS